MRTAFTLLLAAFLSLAVSDAFAQRAGTGTERDPNPGSRGDRVGIEATTASARQPGGYNNYCQTWRVDRAKDRALFGACTAND